MKYLILTVDYYSGQQNNRIKTRRSLLGEYSTHAAAIKSAKKHARNKKWFNSMEQAENDCDFRIDGRSINGRVFGQ